MLRTFLSETAASLTNTHARICAGTQNKQDARTRAQITLPAATPDDLSLKINHFYARNIKEANKALKYRHNILYAPGSVYKDNEFLVYT